MDYLSPCIDAADGGAASPTDHAGAPRYDDPRTPNTGSPTPHGAWADLGAFEFVESAPSSLDLTVAEVMGPTAGCVGDTVDVSWTVLNRGPGIALGPWRDAIELVPVNGTAERTLWVAEVESGRGITLGPGASQSFQAKVVIPPALEAWYRWRVRTNNRGDLHEGAARQNNEAESGVPIAVRVPLLRDGLSLSGTFSPGQTAAYLAVPVVAGEEYRLEMDLQNSAWGVEMFLQAEGVPTAANHVMRAESRDGVPPRLVIPAGVEGRYYVLARLLRPADSATGYTFRFQRQVTADLTAVSPSLCGTAGAVTLEIRGSRFTPEAQAFLLREETEIRAMSVFFGDSTVVYGTWDAAALSAGDYAVEVRDQVLEFGTDGVYRARAFAARRTNALRVMPENPGRLELALQTPSRARAGRPFSAWLTYRNTGGTDLTAPLLLVRAPGCRLRVDDEALDWPDTGQILASSLTGPPIRLRPGQSETLQLRVTLLAIGR